MYLAKFKSFGCNFQEGNTNQCARVDLEQKAFTVPVMGALERQCSLLSYSKYIICNNSQNNPSALYVMNLMQSSVSHYTELLGRGGPGRA